MPYQTGFFPEYGTLTNVMTARELIADGATGIDLSDAFGSVHHALLRRYLQHLHGENCPLPPPHTQPFCSPLSSMLFNLSLDRAMPPEVKTHLLAYADDILLLHEDPTTLQRFLTSLCDRLILHGFKVNGSKCFTIGNSVDLYINGDRVRDGTERDKYLGISISTGSAMRYSSKTTLDLALAEATRILSLSLLLPHFLEADKTYIAPLFIYMGSLGLVSRDTCHHIDVMIKNKLRSIRQIHVHVLPDSLQL
ncbi:hypothetical protein ADUPG1_008106 [Aduncisulcus paluster]|uniref:Reverse transcriptase domain-containing protein n=1 Tax=Aduncisulcus paluster TaxID=2918883 RepID=A0ABQ5KTS3_9EUKA|nr:hypothetical protein ADUPG1_008106 [Aduncisulcus paluster]